MFAWLIGAGFVIVFLVWPTTSTEIVSPLIDPPEPDVVHTMATNAGMMPAPALAVTILAIDNETFEALGSPLPMRRAVFAETLARVRNETPMAIVLDYEISAETTPADAATLLRVLENWSEDDPLLLIAGSFTTNGPETKRIGTKFDDLIDRKQNIKWFNTLYLLDDEGVVRSWNQWESFCEEDKAYLSTQLTLGLLHLHANHSKQPDWEQIEKKLCVDVSAGQPFSLSEPKVVVNRTAPISFILHNQSSAVPLAAKVTSSDGREVPAVFQWSIKDFLSGRVSGAAIENRIVLIGATHRSSRDIHQTPVGQMFGVQVLANSILQAPHVLSAAKLSQTALNAIAAFIALIGLAMFRLLREFFFAVLFFGVCVIAYVSIAWLITASAAADIIQLSIALLVALIALLSLMDILYDAVIARKGWRSFLND